MPPFIRSPRYSATTKAYTIYKCHTLTEMFLVICELIDKLSGQSGLLDGDRDSVYRAIGDRLNKLIVGVNKGSKATCN